MALKVKIAIFLRKITKIAQRLGAQALVCDTKPYVRAQDMRSKDVNLQSALTFSWLHVFGAIERENKRFDCILLRSGTRN